MFERLILKSQANRVFSILQGLRSTQFRIRQGRDRIQSWSARLAACPRGHQRVTQTVGQMDHQLES
jgi:hypothetical protein